MFKVLRKKLFCRSVEAPFKHRCAEGVSELSMLLLKLCVIGSNPMCNPPYPFGTVKQVAPKRWYTKSIRIHDAWFISNVERVLNNIFSWNPTGLHFNKRNTEEMQNKFSLRHKKYIFLSYKHLLVPT